MNSPSSPSRRLEGQLEQTNFAEVLRSVAAAELSGVLKLSRGSVRARIDFEGGKAVAARAPGVKRLGDLLVSLGVSDPITVREAARIQAEEQGRRQLGEILLSHGVVSRGELDRAINLQIDQAVSEVSTWTRGRFEFEPVAARSGLEPELATWPSAEPQPKTSLDRPALLETAEASVSRAPATTPARLTPTRAPLTILLSSKDAPLRREVQRALPTATGSLVTPDSSPATTIPDIEIIDLRPEHSSQARRGLELPRWPWAGIVETATQSQQAYASGAIATLPPVAAAIVAGLATWAPLLPLPIESGSSTKAGLELGTSSLIGDSATVALGLMQQISELVERAVLFLVGGRRLSAVGAFGTNAQGQLLAPLTQGLVLEIAPDSALAVPLRNRAPASLAFESLELPRSVEMLLGEPKTGQALLIPVAGREAVVAMMYADNGDLDRWILDLRPLDAVARRFGPSFETELLIGEAARTLG